MIEQIRTLFNYNELEWNHMMQYKTNRIKKRFMNDVSAKTNNVESEK